MKTGSDTIYFPMAMILRGTAREREWGRRVAIAGLPR
jgi:hypothetical protein